MSSRITRRRAAITALGICLIAGAGATAAFARNSHSTKQAAGKPIIIGAAIAQTSFLAPFDVPPTVAAQFAISDINAHGGVLGRPLKMIFSDTKSDQAAGATAA